MAVTRHLLALVLAGSVATLASAPPATAGDLDARGTPTSVLLSPPGLVVIEGGRVTVEAMDVDLADVLSALGARAEFRLRISGQLGRVTTTFTAVSVEQALRRLVQDHELMLVYSASPDESVSPKLVQADVFASPPSAARVRASSEMLGQQRAGLLVEIQRLARSRDVQRGVPRLAELLGTAPDPLVRARAARALGALGGPPSEAALARALGDSAPDVRVQAAHALRRVGAERAIPALGHVLLADPDAIVRRAAARILGSLQDPAATTALGGAAQESDPLVRREITRALNRQGGSPSP